ncbi:hypothetical protein UK23_44795 [Lentzea aerocolonigenes]|uniref:DUF1772 domain-containing protein n=1 Tax=Lentzea aerocolonigenes TaxID=68170 RepID=A0A0F0GC85_LENAE|nr:hypothetical protein [Lentzea aerocolonigenes]KJK33784.1 hypothetical protein UK23_44795 [Lentzea aerocolonigenes]
MKLLSAALLALAAAAAVTATFLPFSELLIKLAPDQPQTAYVTTGWSTYFGATKDVHAPLFGIPIAAAAAATLAGIRWRKVAFAGAAALAGVAGMLFVYLLNAISFHKTGNIAIDPSLEAGFGNGIWVLIGATVLAFGAVVVHPDD